MQFLVPFKVFIGASCIDMAAFNRIHEHYHRALRPHLVQDRVHPLDKYNDVEFIKRYRFNREGINYITELLINDIAPKGKTNNPIPPVDRICAALRFYASGCFQRTDVDTLHVSQFICVKDVTSVEPDIVKDQIHSGVTFQ